MLDTDVDLWGASPADVFDLLLATLAERPLLSVGSPTPGDKDEADAMAVA
jgi:hypothetical protein